MSVLLIGAGKTGLFDSFLLKMRYNPYTISEEKLSVIKNQSESKQLL